MVFGNLSLRERANIGLNGRRPHLGWTREAAAVQPGVRRINLKKHYVVASLIILATAASGYAEQVDITRLVEQLKGGRVSSEGEDIGQAEAMTALAGIGAPAVPYLQAALKTGTDYQNCAISRTLARIGPKASPALPEVIGALKRAPDSFIHCFPDALAVLGAENTRPIASALENDKVHVRRLVVAHAHTAAHDRRVLSRIIARLSDDDMIVRSNAAGALAKVEGQKEVIDALVKGLNDKEASVRAISAEALGKHKGKARSAVDALKSLTSDGTTFVRTAAAAAIKSIEGNQKEGASN